MDLVPQRQTMLGLLLGAACLGVVLYLGGLATTMQLGDPARRGFILIPALPTPLYITMALVALAAVSTTFLNSLRRRRTPSKSEKQRHQEPLTPSWVAVVSLWAPVVLLIFGVIWLVRYGSRLWERLYQLRNELAALPASLAAGTQTLLQEVHSPLTGYALFVIVIVVYGGITLLGLWILLDRPTGIVAEKTEESPQVRRARRAVTAGLHALQRHDDPRQAIIACYARLEHLLEDHGIPAYDTLTPQEYMGAALQGVDLPMEAFAGLVELFELARYSLHPLDDTAKQTAMAHLETIKSSLEWEIALAPQA
ncbi:MAG: DUF4129 domain-containing protein [Candidatus Tectomicrobia bacterium]